MRKIIVAAGITLISCTSPYPTSVPDIPTTMPEGNGISVNEHQTESSTKTIGQQTEKKGIDRYTSLTSEVRNYDEILKNKIQKLSYQKYAESEIGLLGTLTSVIAAASGAITTALYGGGIAIGGSIAQNRYNYDTQILNYRVARFKLNCIYRSMTDMPSQERDLINDDSRGDGVIVNIIEPYVRNILYEIKFNLETQQYSVALESPDINQLTELLASYKKEKEKGTQSRGAYNSVRESEEERNKLLSIAEKIRTQVGICEISPSSK